MRPILILFAFILLSGCSAIHTQSERIRIFMMASDANTKAEACRAPIQAKPKYSKLYNKLAIAFNEYPTEEQLKDDEVISDPDVQLGIDWYGEFQYCMAKQIEEASKIDPALAIIISNVLKKQISLVNEIVSNHPTYGYINTQIYGLRTSLKDEGKKWKVNLENRLNIMEENEIDQSRDAFISEVGNVSKKFAQILFTTIGEMARAEIELANAVVLYSATHPTYIVTNPIRTTNCNVFGNQITCNSF
ncbi:hypothetical protein J0667_15010 [Methylomonas sp. WH-1]|uniref:hypothetical protein n=1 Tax=unclassified Methylomonas TaxID=2608980 RepID=UPI00101EA6B5|nr:hypothetical protein [Methylomonas sp. LW13]